MGGWAMSGEFVGLTTLGLCSTLGGVIGGFVVLMANLELNHIGGVLEQLEESMESFKNNPTIYIVEQTNSYNTSWGTHTSVTTYFYLPDGTLINTLTYP